MVKYFWYYRRNCGNIMCNKNSKEQKNEHGHKYSGY